MELIKITEENGIDKMTTKEIAELTGKDHKNVLRDCDNLNESYEKLSLLKLEPCSFKAENGRKYRAYSLTKMQCFDLMTGYSTELRIKVNRRWEELEKAKHPSLPQNYIEALKALVISEEEKLLAQKEVKELKPKGEFYDAVTGSCDTVDISTVAKVLNVGIGRNKLFQFLRDQSILMNNNQPYQNYIDRGYFRVIESTYSKPDGSTHISLKTVVFQSGIDYIRKQIEKKYENESKD